LGKVQSTTWSLNKQIQVQFECSIFVKEERLGDGMAICHRCGPFKFQGMGELNRVFIFYNVI